jgi:hypothetical protein
MPTWMRILAGRKRLDTNSSEPASPTAGASAARCMSPVAAAIDLTAAAGASAAPLLLAEHVAAEVAEKQEERAQAHKLEQAHDDAAAGQPGREHQRSSSQGSNSCGGSSSSSSSGGGADAVISIDTLLATTPLLQATARQGGKPAGLPIWKASPLLARASSQEELIAAWVVEPPRPVAAAPLLGPQEDEVSADEEGKGRPRSSDCDTESEAQGDEKVGAKAKGAAAATAAATAAGATGVTPKGRLSRSVRALKQLKARFMRQEASPTRLPRSGSGSAAALGSPASGRGCGRGGSGTRGGGRGGLPVSMVNDHLMGFTGARTG